MFSIPLALGKALYGLIGRKDAGKTLRAFRTAPGRHRRGGGLQGRMRPSRGRPTSKIPGCVIQLEAAELKRVVPLRLLNDLGWNDLYRHTGFCWALAFGTSTFCGCSFHQDQDSAYERCATATGALLVEAAEWRHRPSG